MVRPTGVEPVSMASEATILSIELWAHERAGLYDAYGWAAILIYHRGTEVRINGKSPIAASLPSLRASLTCMFLCVSSGASGKKSNQPCFASNSFMNEISASTPSAGKAL